MQEMMTSSCRHSQVCISHQERAERKITLIVTQQSFMFYYAAEGCHTKKGRSFTHCSAARHTVKVRSYPLPWLATTNHKCCTLLWTANAGLQSKQQTRHISHCHRPHNIILVLCPTGRLQNCKKQCFPSYPLHCSQVRPLCTYRRSDCTTRHSFKSHHYAQQTVYIYSSAWAPVLLLSLSTSACSSFSS